MLFIDAVLIILRLTQIDKQSAKKSAKDASQPLGVRVGVKERKGGQRLPLPSSPVKEVFDAVPSSSLPSSSTPDLDAALRAFHTLVGPTADNLPSPTPSADVSGTVTLGNDSPATPKDASAQTGVRRRRRAD